MVAGGFWGWEEIEIRDLRNKRIVVGKKTKNKKQRVLQLDLNMEPRSQPGIWSTTGLGTFFCQNSRTIER